MSSQAPVIEHLYQIPNTMALTCKADAALVLQSESQLGGLTTLARRYGQTKLIGGASNLLLPEQLGGLAVLVRLRGISLYGQDDHFFYVDVQAGEIWHDWVATALRHGWYGLENLALIPGTVGAAPVQNIGAYGVEVGQLIHSVRIWDVVRGEMRTLDRESCHFAYRDSIFKRQQAGVCLIVSVRFALPKRWKPMVDYPDLDSLRVRQESGESVTSQDVFDAVVKVRRHKLPDPDTTPNCGSFFKNPVVSTATYAHLRATFPGLVAYPQDSGLVKLAAGWLIDQCGWKGRVVGCVRVHERQALVLTNTGGATQKQVLSVADMICQDVRTRFGVDLEMEPACWLD